MTTTWKGQPAECRCAPGAVVATLKQTLRCPNAWIDVPGTGWVHTRWRRWDPRGGAR